MLVSLYNPLYRDLIWSHSFQQNPCASDDQSHVNSPDSPDTHSTAILASLYEHLIAHIYNEQIGPLISISKSTLPSGFPTSYWKYCLPGYPSQNLGVIHDSSLPQLLIQSITKYCWFYLKNISLICWLPCISTAPPVLGTLLSFLDNCNYSGN